MTVFEFLAENIWVAYVIISIFSIIIVIVLISLFKRMFKKKAVIDWDDLKQKVQEDKHPKKKVKKVITEEELKEDVLKPFKLSKFRSKISWIYWKEKYFDKYLPDKVMLIHFELANGFFRQFLIKEKDEGFIYKGKKYIFDDENKTFNIDAKLYQFYYHENITLPISLKIPVTDVKKTIESATDVDIKYAINPATLQRFMTAKIAEGVMKGTQLDEFLRKLNMFIIVIMVTVLAHLVLYLYASGIFSNLKGIGGFG